MAFSPGLPRLPGPTAQRRLIDQDMRLAHLIESRVPAAQEEDHEKIGALKGRLRRQRRGAARVRGRGSGLASRVARPGAISRLRPATYIDFVVNVLGARSHSLRHLTSTLLSEADWGHITG